MQQQLEANNLWGRLRETNKRGVASHFILTSHTTAHALIKSRPSALCESDGSKKLEADIPAYGADTLFSKHPQSGKADNRTDTVPLLTYRFWQANGVNFPLRYTL